jgi:cytochrome P450
MSITLGAPPARPAHVPQSLVRQIDFLHPERAADEPDVFLAWKKIRDTSPEIFWTPEYGGHWVFTRAEDIETAIADFERFSMHGHSIPRNITPNVPLELDPPVHGPVRAMLSPFFSPKVVKELSAQALIVTTQLIDEFLPLGECEFVEAFARQLPIILFLKLADLPVTDRKFLLDLATIRVRDPNQARRNDAKIKILDYLQDVIATRRANKGTDLISNMLHGKVNGETLPDDVMQNMLAQVMFGGLDTVANLVSSIALTVAVDVELRRKLQADPSLMASGFDELARRHSLICMAREITHDLEYKGVQMKQGEQVLLPYILHSFDESRFPNGETIDFNRPNVMSHVTFGGGPHRCPGAVLARAETRVFLEQWLQRIPEFEVDPTKKPPVIEGGRVMGVTYLPLRWKV